jgi:hypothetical protein
MKDSTGIAMKFQRDFRKAIERLHQNLPGIALRLFALTVGGVLAKILITLNKG